MDVDDGDFGALPPQYEVVFSDGRLNSERTVTRGPSRRLSRPVLQGLSPWKVSLPELLGSLRRNQPSCCHIRLHYKLI